MLLKNKEFIKINLLFYFIVVITLLYPQIIVFFKLNYFYDLGLVLKNFNNDAKGLQPNSNIILYSFYNIITFSKNNLFNTHIIIFFQSITSIIVLLIFYNFFDKFLSLIIGTNFIFWANITNDFHYEHLVIFFLAIFYLIKEKTDRQVIKYFFLIPIILVKDIYIILVCTLLIIDLYDNYKIIFQFFKLQIIVILISFIILLIFIDLELFYTIKHIANNITFNFIFKKFLLLLIISSSFLFINLLNRRLFLIFFPYFLFIIITDNQSNLSIFTHHSAYLLIPAVYYLYIEKEKLSLNRKKLLIIINIIFLFFFTYFPFNYNNLFNLESKIYYKNFYDKKNTINQSLEFIKDKYEINDNTKIYIMNNYGYFLSEKKYDFYDISNEMFVDGNFNKILILNKSDVIFYRDKLCNNSNNYCNFGSKENFYLILDDKLLHNNWDKNYLDNKTTIYSKKNYLIE